jgi:hypothetical protein
MLNFNLTMHEKDKGIVSTGLGYILWLFLISGSPSIRAQNKLLDLTAVASANFELTDGDRVVFLGNSLFENDLQYGYLELALTTRWPQRNVTYRNIGWTGDTVWGDARSYYLYRLWRHRSPGRGGRPPPV